MVITLVRFCWIATNCWVTATVCGWATPTRGATPYLLHGLRSPDAAAGDEFGRSAALDGRLGLIGAPSRDEIGTDSGAAYLVDVLTGEQRFKLVPDDGQAGAQFGNSVAIQGDRAVVGAMLQHGDAQLVGAAYIFDTTTGEQLHKLTASNGARGDEFGVSVALDDGIVLVGSHKHGPGAAYLFDVQTGAELGILRANDAAPDDLFGVAVALDAGRALVGARYDDDADIASGSAYLFDVHTQQQLHKLTPHDGERGDRFGMHLDIGRNHAVVGSRYDDDAMKSSGSAYVYDVETGEQLWKLVAEDATPSDEFGSAISVDRDLVLIGAVDDDHNGAYAGSAYLFNLNTGEQLFKFEPDDAAPLDRLGMSVAMDNGVMLLGASMLNYPGAPLLPSGRAYVYLVPEPSTVVLALLGCIVACRFRG
jgi:outer membrane protein assembly factor BamB